MGVATATLTFNLALGYLAYRVLVQAHKFQQVAFDLVQDLRQLAPTVVEVLREIAHEQTQGPQAQQPHPPQQPQAEPDEDA